jgi:hypothetical protein
MPQGVARDSVDAKRDRAYVEFKLADQLLRPFLSLPGDLPELPVLSQLVIGQNRVYRPSFGALIAGCVPLVLSVQLVVATATIVRPALQLKLIVTLNSDHGCDSAALRTGKKANSV